MTGFWRAGRMSDEKPRLKPTHESLEGAGGLRVEPGGFVRGLVGAVVGAVAGYYVFFFFAKKGIVLLALPGALVGLGRVMFVRRRSWALALICLVVGVALELYIANDLFAEGLRALGPWHYVIISVGGAVALYFGLGRDPRR
jgi:hypothetical protein